jgi:hypothetical protein
MNENNYIGIVSIDIAQSSTRRVAGFAIACHHSRKYIRTMTMGPSQTDPDAASVSVLGQPLLRLLAINLAIGAAAAVLLLGGLIALNPDRLRDLILADSSPLTALGLLLFGFLITFGSVAMGTAIMAIGRSDDDGTPGRTETIGGDTIDLPLVAARAYTHTDGGISLLSYFSSKTVPGRTARSACLPTLRDRMPTRRGA